MRIQTSPLVWVVSREYLLYTRSLDFRSLPGAGKCQLSKYIRALPLVVTLTSWPVVSKIIFVSSGEKNYNSEIYQYFK